MPTDYAEKLKDPRWIKLSAAKKFSEDYICEGCKAKPVEGIPKDFGLSTHHKFYDLSREPWEYRLDELVCLCKTCHLMLHFEKYYPGRVNLGVSKRGWGVLSRFLASLPEECYPRIQFLSFKANRIILKWIFIDGIDVPHYASAMKLLEYHQASIPPKTGKEAEGVQWLVR